MLINKSPMKTVRAAAILTNGYVAGTVITDCHAFNQLTLLVKFTKGNLTDAQIKIETSEDGTTYYQETFGSISSTVKTLSLGVLKMAASGNYTYQIPVSTEFIKVSIIGTDDVTNSSATIDAVLAEV